MSVIVKDRNCPTCQSGQTRETTGMVCQTCGTDYAPLWIEANPSLVVDADPVKIRAAWEEATSAPTPIDPADIRAGDTFRLTYEATCDRVMPSGSIRATNGYSFSPGDDIDTTWHLVHRPDPDAEAVDALVRAASVDTAGDTYSGEQTPERTLARLRDQGWDVVQTVKVGYHGKYSSVIDHAASIATCMNGDPHPCHEWRYTDEGGGHMIEERSAGPDDKKWHCPGRERRAES